MNTNQHPEFEIWVDVKEESASLVGYHDSNEEQAGEHGLWIARFHAKDPAHARRIFEAIMETKAFAGINSPPDDDELMC